MTASADELQRLLLEQITESVILVDARRPDFPILAVNRACREVFAGPEGSVVGRPWTEVFPDAAPQSFLAILRRVAETGAPFEAREFPYQRASSARRPARPEELTYWDWKCLPLRDDAGAVERLLVLLTDATERRMYQRGQVLSRQIVEQIPLGIAVTAGADHILTMVSPDFARMVGQEEAAIVGRPFAMALPELAGTALVAALAAVRERNDPAVVEAHAFRAADGETRNWNLAIMPMPNLDGEVEGLMLMATDLTAQVRARREIEELAAAAQRRAGQLEAIIGSMVDGVFILDAQGLVSEANEAAMTILGLLPDVRSRRLSDYVAARGPRRGDGRSLAPDTDVVGEMLAQVLAGQTVPDEQLILDGGGAGQSGQERLISLSAAPVTGVSGRVAGAVVLVRDITAQKRADQEKDAFLSLISHEVKSPLTAIKGFAQLATRATASGATGEKIARHLRVIDQQVERIGRLVSDLADVARIQQGMLQQEPTDVDLAPVVRTVIEQSRVTLTSHRLELTIAGEPLVVHADPGRLEQVLTNLLTNAVKYSPDADRVTIILARDGDHAHLTVRDEGIGIPRAEVPRLFGRFYRASNGVASGLGGLGLGLYITHEIIVGSGGRIWVESDEGQGSAFHITLPLVSY